LAAAKVVVQN